MTWILFTAGRGPIECQMAITKVVSRFNAYAKEAGLQTHTLDCVEGEHGLMSCLLSVEGTNAREFVGDWEGTIEWKCPSPLRNTRRKNWFVGARVILAPSPEFGLDHTQLKFETFRASGPGGQHVNTTNSAVRVTHIPSGLVAQAQEERSQYRNKALATGRLMSMLLAAENAKHKAVEQSKWTSHNTVERGKAVKTFVGLQFQDEISKSNRKEVR